MLEFGDPSRPVDLIFLHANGFNALTYRALLEPLAEGAHILAIDQRGHGRTTLETRTEGRRSWMDLGEDLTALLEAMDLSDVILAGHSMGGAVSVFAAASVPDRVRRLMLLDPVMPPPRSLRRAPSEPSPLVAGALKRRAVFPSREAVVETYSGRSAFKAWAREMLVDYVADGFLDMPSGEVTLACRPEWESSSFAAQDQDPWEALPHTRCPIAILRAQFDSTCWVGDWSEAATATGRVSITTVEGASHFLPMERPDLCRAALREALEA
jgi:pimeloyl-ACP methyl ester carboxylesterase